MHITWKAIAVAPLAVVALAGPVTASPEPVDDPVDFLELFDDPTSVAREVDATMGSVLSECMSAQGQTHVVDENARFTIETLTLEDALAPTFERSLGDILPRLVEPEVLTIDTELLGTLNDEQLLSRGDLLIEPDLLIDENVIAIAEDPVLARPRLTDVDLRLEPLAEGYGISLGAYEITEPDSNIAVVAELAPIERVDYETALFGAELRTLGSNETGGCAEASLGVLFDEVIPQLEAMDAELAELEQTIMSDPEFGDAVAEWSGCVAESGLPEAADLRSLDDAVELTRDRFVAAGSDREALDAARDFERQLAAVDFECRALTTDLAIAAVVADVGAPYVERSVSAIDRIREVSR